MTTARDVVARARALIGAPFAHQGRTADGLDCLGLLLLVAEREAITFDGRSALALDVPDYGARPDTLALRKKLDTYLRPIEPDQLKPADIVLLKIEGLPRHLAIISDYPFAGELGMIHAYAPARSVVEHRFDAAWRQACYGAYRLPHLTQHSLSEE